MVVGGSRESLVHRGALGRVPARSEISIFGVCVIGRCENAPKSRFFKDFSRRRVATGSKLDRGRLMGGWELA